MKNNKITIALFSCLLLAGCNNSTSEPTNTDTGSIDTGTSITTTTSQDSSTDSSKDSTSNSSSNAVELNDLMIAAEKASKKASEISSGKIVLTESDSYSSEPTVKEMSFEFGKDDNGDVLHYVDYDWNNNKFDSYIMNNSAGEVVAIDKKSDGSISKQYSSYEKVDYLYQNLLGYGETSFYGSEGLLSGLLSYLEKNVNKDAKIGFANDEYSFSFGYFSSIDTMEYYVVTSSFKVGKSEELAKFNVQIDSYNQSAFHVDDELQTIYLLDNASPSSTKKYDISQNVGKRTFVNPIDLNGFYATSFDLMYNEAKVEENSTIEMEIGTDASISLANVVPETTSFDFDTISVEVITGDSGALSGYFNTWSNEISLSATSVGTFKISVSSTNVTKTFTVTVNDAQPKEIFASYFVEGPDGYVAYSLGDSISAYVGITYIFSASVSPAQADQNIHSSVNTNGLKYTLETKTIKVNDYVDEKDMVCFTPLSEGDYDLVLESASKTDVKLTTHFTVSKMPTFSEVLSSDFAWRQGSQIKYYFSFTPDVSSEGQSGHVTISDRTSNKQENATYTISTLTNGYEFKFTHVDGEEFNLTVKMSKDFMMIVYVDGYGNEMSKVTVEFMLSGGTWAGTSGDYQLNLNFYNNGEANVSFMKTDYSVSKYFSCNFVITQSGEGYVGTFTSNSYTEDPFIALPVTFTVNNELNSISMNFDYDDVSYSFTLTISADY